MIGKVLKNRYYILSLLGIGGMAEVYLADDKINNRKVAIKIIKESTSLDPLNIARFQREARASAALSHPNIVKIYDVDNYNDRPYMVMEYVESKNLKDFIVKRGNFSVSESLDIIYQLSDALYHAHQHGVVHRDVKPQNVMIQIDGNIKLADFGIAIISDAPQITKEGTALGSVHYMAPEVLKGSQATPKSDIYSLGITFFELLTGKTPFNDSDATSIAMKHLSNPFPSVRKMRNDVPIKIEKIIYKACQKNPNSRYTNMKAFRIAVENMMRIPIGGKSFFSNLFKKGEKNA